MSNSISIQEYTYLSDYVYNVGRNENNLLSLDGMAKIPSIQVTAVLIR